MFFLFSKISKKKRFYNKNPYIVTSRQTTFLNVEEHTQKPKKRKSAFSATIPPAKSAAAVETKMFKSSPEGRFHNRSLHSVMLKARGGGSATNWNFAWQRDFFLLFLCVGTMMRMMRTTTVNTYLLVWWKNNTSSRDRFPGRFSRVFHSLKRGRAPEGRLPSFRGFSNWCIRAIKMKLSSF